MPVEKERLSSLPFLPNWVWKEHNERFRFVNTLCANKDVLDCACGTGVGTHFFSQSARAVVALDISPEATKEASARCHDRDNIIFKQGSATKLPLADESVDLYVSLETIEHLENDVPYLDEAVRVLRPGGIFICSTPNRTVTNPGKTLIDKPTNPFHVREYSTREFKNILEKKFSNVTLFAQNPVGSIVTKPLNVLGTILPFHLTTRFHQSFKLLLSFLRKENYYAVQEMQPSKEYEYVIALCKKD